MATKTANKAKQKNKDNNQQNSAGKYLYLFIFLTLVTVAVILFSSDYFFNKSNKLIAEQTSAIERPHKQRAINIVPAPIADNYNDERLFELYEDSITNLEAEIDQLYLIIDDLDSYIARLETKIDTIEQSSPTNLTAQNQLASLVAAFTSFKAQAKAGENFTNELQLLRQLAQSHQPLIANIEQLADIKIIYNNYKLSKELDQLSEQIHKQYLAINKDNSLSSRIMASLDNIISIKQINGSNLKNPNVIINKAKHKLAANDVRSAYKILQTIDNTYKNNCTKWFKEAEKYLLV